MHVQYLLYISYVNAIYKYHIHSNVSVTLVGERGLTNIIQYVWYIATEDMNVSVCHLPPDSVAPSHVNIEHALELCTPP